jgi:DNA (cytosine-5)-methyltransferase 1
MNYIDLFSGAGGFSGGFDLEGFKNVFSIDSDSQSCETYRYNFPKHKLIEDSIENIEEKKIKLLIKNKKIDVIIGGPPCQGFSMAGVMGRKFVNDPRNKLFKEFAKIVSIVRPKFFVMENVQRLFIHNKGKTRNEILEYFKKLNYFVECKVLNSADYGLPQVRRRVFFIGSLKKCNIIFPEPTGKSYVSIKEAINNLPKLKSGQTSKIANHVAMNHSDQMLKKMNFISDGGNRNKIPEIFRPKSGDVRKYVKYDSEKPSICVTGDMRKVFHYSQNRALTVRELARIQTFPDNFIFKGTRISQQQQVGNAVPVLLARAVAKSLKKMIKDVFK